MRIRLIAKRLVTCPQAYLGSKSFFPRETVEGHLEALYGAKEVDLEEQESFRMSYIEDYHLYRGRGDGVGQRINIGHWKGVIRVTYPVVGESDDMQKLFCNSLKKEKVTVRLYVLQAENLETMDASGKYPN